MLLIEKYDAKALAFLKVQCRQFAQNFNMDYRDILSAAHERLAKQMVAGLVINDDEHFNKLLKTIVHHAASDISRRRYFNSEKSTDPTLMVEPSGHDSVDHDARDLFQIVDGAIRREFSNNQKLIAAYDYCILGGYTIEKASELLDVHISTIKTNMRMVRSFANKLKPKLN
jgi:DNA-directed RNA polymerase specialized sigma24 family protein